MPAVVALAPVALLIVPPVAFPPTLVFAPSPVTVSPPLEPVPFRTIPFAGPAPAEVPAPAEMLWNVSPLAPILVLEPFGPAPVVVSILWAEPVTLTVPPPVAPNPGPLVVSMLRPPPVRLIVGLDPVEENAAPVPVFSVFVA